MTSAVQPVRPEIRPRSKSSFSFRSQKSDKSSGSRQKLDFQDAEENKRRSEFLRVTKSNPNRAITEEQPATIAQSEQATLSPLRSIQHKDWNTGAVITDPDASNPARSRMERPLDTIRSFQSAADGGDSSRRSHAFRTESAGAIMGYSSRRSSMLGALDGSPYQNHSQNPRYALPNGSYDPRRASSFRPNYDPARGQPQMHPRRGMGQRMSSVPLYGRDSTQQGNYVDHQAYENGCNGESSQSEPWGNSTNPSSENSSLDRIHAAKFNDPTGDAYGAGQFAGQYGPGAPLRGPITEEGWGGRGGRDFYYDDQQYHNGESSPRRSSQYNGGSDMRHAASSSQQLPGNKQLPPRPMIKLGGDRRQQEPHRWTQRQLSNGKQPFGQQQAPPASEYAPPSTFDAKRSKLEKKKASPEGKEKRASWIKRAFGKS